VPYIPGSDAPTVRRGPHPLLAFLGFAALVIVAMTIVLAITTIGRMVS
jgi:hypothetical protein